MTDLRIEALDYARRLAATLEQYNADPHTKQVEALRAELDKVRHQLHNAGNAAIWSAGVLRGEPVPPRSPGVPISLLETAASEARTKITEQAREINSRDNQIDQMAADIAKLTSRASIAEAASREKDKKLAEFRKANDTAIAILDEAQFSTLTPDDYNNNPLLREIAQRVMGGAEQVKRLQDRIHQLELVHDQQVAALTAARNNVDALQRDQVREHADRLEAIQMLQGKRSATLTTNEVGAMLLREVSAVMRALESNSVTIRNLQEDHLVKNVGAERLRERLAEANDTIAKQAREIDSLRADLRKEQKIKDFVNDECQKIRAALGLGRMAQAPEVLAAIDALQVDASMKQHTIEGLRGKVNDLEQTIAKAAPVEPDKKLADSLKMRLAEANDRIRHMTDVIKELHAQYHELEARKQATQYDLDRAKEEIEFAEAEIAKYKPLVEAVRFGIVYGYWGEWVPINSVTVADMNDGTAVSLFIPNSEDPRCL